MSKSNYNVSWELEECDLEIKGSFGLGQANLRLVVFHSILNKPSPQQGPRTIPNIKYKNFDTISERSYFKFVGGQTKSTFQASCIVPIQALCKNYVVANAYGNFLLLNFELALEPKTYSIQDQCYCHQILHVNSPL